MLDAESIAARLTAARIRGRGGYEAASSAGRLLAVRAPSPSSDGSRGISLLALRCRLLTDDDEPGQFGR